MFKNEIKTRMMAFAVVAMFMLTAFSVVLVEDSDAEVSDVTGNGTAASPYSINLRVDDEFTYQAATNIADGTTAFAAYKYSGSNWNTEMPSSSTSEMNFDKNTKTMSGKYTQAGTYQTKIVATWTSGTLSQTAEQYITFVVIEKFTVNDIDNQVFLRGSINANDQVAPIDITNSPSAGIDWTVSAVDSNSVSVPYFKIGTATTTGATNSILFNSIPTANDINDDPGYETYTVTVTATGKTPGISSSSQQVTKTFTVTISKNVTATSTVTINTFIGASGAYADTNKGVAVFTSPFTVSENTIKTGSNSHITPTVVNGEATYTVGISANTDYGFSESSANNVATETVTYVATGVVTGVSGPTQNVDVNVTYNVYAKLGFITSPSADGSATYYSSNNSLLALVSTNIAYANKVIYDWGDNSNNTIKNVIGEQSVVTESHLYNSKGIYKITITAFNDFGSSSSIVMYNADGGSSLEPATTYEVTIKDGSDASKLVGKVTVEDGKTFAIKDITIDSDYDMSGKKIVNLYTAPAGDDGKFDETKLWKSTNTVTGATTLYAEIEDKSATENFFDEHGWLFILFGVIGLLILVLGYLWGVFAQFAPWNFVVGIVLIILAVLLFFNKDFAGIWDAITGIFNKE